MTVTPLGSLINCNDDRFLNSAQMTEVIRQYCRETNQPVPGTKVLAER